MTRSVSPILMRTSIVVALLALGPALLADTPPPPPPLAIHRTAGAIVVDGDLSDAGWQNAATLDQFWEGSPGDDIPARVKTIVKLAYDDRAFYIGIRCEDPHPEKIRAPFVDRDNVLGTDDNIAVFLDTRNDRRSALELRVNPRGIQGDAIFNDANGNEDFSPDFFYDTAARIDAGGWSAEYRIPFSSLRYPKTDPQTWGILVWRNYPREYRYAFYSAPVPRGSNCLVCHVHEITGFTGLPEASHFVAAPYVTGQQEADADPNAPGELHTSPVRGETGLDLKWNPSADHAIDLTLNPDFSQIEADIPQITVNQRFAVFYPEKRPFFLEGFDLFDTPLQVAYTRTVVSPRWGMRGTGKMGDSAYTVLISDDRGGGYEIVPGALGSSLALQDFRSLATIARVRHDLGSSFVGAVLTDREEQGGAHNRVFGPDLQWRPNESNTITAQLVVSDTRNPNRPDLSPFWRGERLQSHAAYVSYAYQTRTYDASVAVRDIGDDFRANLGFMPEVGYRQVVGVAGRTWYPEGLLRQIRPSVLVDHQWDQHGNVIFNQVSLGVNFLGVKNLNGGIFYRPAEATLFDEKTGATPRQSYVVVNLQYDPSRRFTRIGINAQSGEAIDFANGAVGRGHSIRVYSTLRPLDRLTFNVDTTRQWLNENGSRAFTAQVEYLKTEYSFSAKSLVRGVGQYIATHAYGLGATPHSGSFLGSILYSYKLNWQTVLFAGYGDDRIVTETNRLQRFDRSLFFKVSYAVQR
jgi:Domain of unknown function (DUF5916)/Carbohydrate family 9 binding domain-like